MITITLINCNQGSLDGPLKVLTKIYKEFEIKHPNWFHLMRYQRGSNNWDGKIHYIKENGRFRIGLLPMIYQWLVDNQYKVKVIDKRPPLGIVPSIPLKVGNLKLRDEQKYALAGILGNRVGGVPFMIGVGDLAVNFGKCNGKDSLLNTDRGIFKISELVNKDNSLVYPGIKVLSKDHKYHETLGGVYNKIKALRITTRMGYSQIVGFDRHKYYTLKGDSLDWVLAKNLKVGDWLPLYKGEVTPNTREDISPEIAYLMGCLQGDGHISYLKSDNPNKAVRISISGEDFEIAEELILTLTNLCGEAHYLPHSKFKGFKITKSHPHLSKLIETKFPELIGNANQKIIPKSILDSSKKIQCHYIAGLFDTDGSKHKDVREFSFSSICQENITRLHYMLLNLGIVSFTSIKKTLCTNNSKKGISYRLRIPSVYYDKFAELIPLRLKRKLPDNTKPKRNNYSDSLPPMIGIKAKAWYNSQNYTTRYNPLSKYGRTIKSQIIHTNRLTLNSLSKLLKEAPNQELQELYDFSKAAYWDQIKTIEIIPEYECYDIEVKDTHNYIADGFICHNTLLMASLYHAFNKKLRTLLITNDSDWLQQARKEFPELIDSKELTFVQGGNCMGWKGFTVGMVQSISRNIKKYQSELSKIDMVLIDEADIIDNKTYRTVIEHLYNTRVRIGLSGTIYLSKLKKDLMTNMNIKSFIGEKLVEVKLHEMIKKGYSTDVIVKMIPTKYRLPDVDNDYKDEYDAMITNNKQGYQLSLERMQFNIKYGRLPALVVTKFIKHCENLYAHYNKELGDTYNIAKVHVDTPKKERNKIIEDFRNGKIDILISTTITSRGKNFPLLRYLQNAGDGDSNERAIQILGRLVRTHKSKKKTYYDDIWYNGTYLSRHARHRKNYYIKEKLKVIDLTRIKRNKHNS